MLGEARGTSFVANGKREAFSPRVPLCQNKTGAWLRTACPAGLFWGSADGEGAFRHEVPGGGQPLLSRRWRSCI